jgi:hypothetical protein
MSTGGRILTAALAVLLVALVGVGVWALTHPQRIADQFAFWGFDPTPAVAEYADRTTMTDEGKFLFYASEPSVAADGDFDGTCSTQQEDVGILGCYLPSSKRIFLYDVTDDRLDGLEEVVAAHEMLHAVWDRMSAQEQAELEPLLEAEVAARSDDPALAKTLAFYAEAEPGERANELHSIVGTEFGDIGPELEAHYALYFSDRAALTALHEQSNAVFVQQQQAIDTLITQIDSLADSIDTDYAAYNSGYDELNADIASFNSRADAGDFPSLFAFNQERDALVQRQDELDAFYDSIAARKAQYDDLVTQLDALNAEVDELNQSINIEPRDDEGL